MSESVKPTPQQAAFQDWELGLFMHFGLMTFCPEASHDRRDTLDPKRFNPTQLDCGQWADAAIAAGCRYGMMTVKHHDGFVNWPSKFTKNSVASSPWKNGQGDVVREYVDAFRSRGLKVGLYYSPYDSDPFTQYDTDEKAYDEYFLNQLGEILQNYGTIDYLWFDGAGSERHSYDWPRIVGEIRRMQPDILLFQMGDPDARWVGNEAGVAPLRNWNVVDPHGFRVPAMEQLVLSQPKWMPAECDSMLSEHWFYSDDDEQRIKSLDLLLGEYYYSVGRGSNMLINIGPDRRGLLPEKCVERLVEFGREVQRRFAKPLAGLADFHAEDELTWTYRAPAQPFELDHVVIQEDILQGEHVRRYAVQIDTSPDHHGEPIIVHEGYSIGRKAICHFPLIRAREVLVKITEADGPVNLRNIEVFNSTV